MVIAVPVLSVNAVGRECFKFPWTCLIEKPAGYNVNDAEELAGYAAQANRPVFVALNRRHHSSTKTVLKDLEGLTGPRLIHVQDQEDQEAALRDGQPRLVVENWMYANSIHVIDLFRILGRGDVVAVEPIIRWNPQEPRFVAAKIAFDSGDIGLYQAVWNGPGPWAVSVTTQEKRWELRPLELASFQRHGSRKLEPAPVHEWDFRFKSGLRVQAQLAVQAAMGQPTPTLPSLEDALVSMRLVQAIYGNGLTRCPCLRVLQLLQLVGVARPRKQRCS